MKKIDTSNWSVATISVGDHLFEERTLQSEEYTRSFCEKYGYTLVSFVKGTDRLCA